MPHLVHRLTFTLVLVFLPTTLWACDSPAQDFFDNLADLCGERFEGYADFPKDPGDAFAGKLLVATITECNDDEIRIPFLVGDDASRTWVISIEDQGLQLKHDHRHADGSPDEITWYGGIASQAGTPQSQSFPADSHTAELIPDAASNEWFLSLNDGNSEMTYYLERHGEPRFRARLLRIDP